MAVEDLVRGFVEGLEWNVVVRILIGVLGSLYMGLRAIKKGKLTRAGGLLAAVVGSITTVMGGYRAAVLLMTFFLTSSKLTSFAASKKVLLEDNYVIGGNRTPAQVVANGGWATLLCVVYFYHFSWKQLPFKFDTPADGCLCTRLFTDSSYILAGIIAHYACCNGDTWASELGIINPQFPRLITAPWRVVPPGTNGGISLFGTLSAILGGLVIGIAFFISEASIVGFPELAFWKFALFGALCGFVGSMIDSLLGATLQYSGWSEPKKKVVNEPEYNSKGTVLTKHICGFNLLSNNSVNLISSVLSSISMAIAAPYIMNL